MIKYLILSVVIFMSSTVYSTVFRDKEVYVITNGNVYQVFGDKMFKLEYVGGKSKHIGSGFDTSDWYNSLIKREV